MNEFLMNRLANCGNSYQGTYKRVLVVCSAGLLRSPTAALVLSQAPYNYNTRAAGLVKEFALIPVDEVLLTWAEEIVCMTPDQAMTLSTMKGTSGKRIVCLNISDSYAYRAYELQSLIKDNYNKEAPLVTEV